MDKQHGEIVPTNAATLRRVLEAEESSRADRRIDPRVAVKLAVEVRLSSAELRTVYTENLSQGGILLAMARPVSIPSTIDLTIRLPDGHCVELSGAIRHVEHSPDPTSCRVGVQFTSISEDARRALVEALADGSSER